MLSSMMMTMSGKDDLSCAYMNHSICRTCGETLDSCGLDVKDIMTVTGDRHPESLRPFLGTTSLEHKHQMSDASHQYGQACIGQGDQVPAICEPDKSDGASGALCLSDKSKSARSHLGLMSKKSQLQSRADVTVSGKSQVDVGPVPNSPRNYHPSCTVTSKVDVGEVSQLTQVSHSQVRRSSSKREFASSQLISVIGNHEALSSHVDKGSSQSVSPVRSVI